MLFRLRGEGMADYVNLIKLSVGSESVERDVIRTIYVLATSLIGGELKPMNQIRDCVYLQR